MDEEIIETTYTNQDDQKTNTDFTKLIASFGALILDKAFLALLIGAIGYFLGWRFLYTYYGSFGLDASFFRFTPTEVISAGWRSFLILAALIIVAAFMYNTVRFAGSKLILTKGWGFTFRLFILFLFFCLISLLIGWYLFYNRWGTYLLKEFFIWSILVLALLWITYISGESLYETNKYIEGNKSVMSSLFRIVFPSPFLWLISIILGLILLMMFLSSYNGSIYARRDKSVDSTLQIASIYVNEKLDISDGQLIRNNIWKYDDLRFLSKVDDTFFVFRVNEVRGTITKLYAIPADRVVEFRLKSWWATRVASQQ